MAENETVSVETSEVEAKVEAETPTETPKADNRDKEIAKLRQELDKHKKRLSEVNSEAAGYKRELKANKSAAEVAEMERAEKQSAMEKELAELKREKTISDYRGRFIGLGFDDDVANETANAYADGDVETVFTNFKSLLDNIRRNSVASAMDSQRGLTVGDAPTSHNYTRADIASMSAEEINANWGDIKKTLR